MSSTEPKKYYGAQTKTSIKSFNISLKNDPVPLTIIKALAILKKSFAIVNQQFGLEQGISNAIVQASTEIITEKFNDQFPLSAFQPGSGIITNMNVNEVIANRAMEIIDGFAGHIHVDPTRHVNMNQNENNTFAIAMNISIILELKNRLYPSVDVVQKILKQKHYDGYDKQVTINIQNLQNIQSHLYKLFVDDVAGQTSMNVNFGKSVVQHIKRSTGFNFISVSTKVEELNIFQMMIELSGGLNTLAITLMKTINDIDLLDSKSHAGDQMNVNHYEPMTMVAAQVMGNHVAINHCLSMGNFKFNALKPLIIKNVLNSIYILSDVSYSLMGHLLGDIELKKDTSTTSTQSANLGLSSSN